MIAIKEMEISECLKCRFSIDRGGHPWCAAQSAKKRHYIDLGGKGYWLIGFREKSCPLVKGPEAQWKWSHVVETYKCTNCNFEIVENDVMAIEDYSYCPRCGALIDDVIYETE